MNIIDTLILVRRRTMVATNGRNLRRTPLERWTPCAHESMQVGPGRDTQAGAGRWARGPAAAEGSVARRSLVSTQVVAGAVSFPLAGRRSAKRQPRVGDPFPSAPGFIPAQPHCRSLPFLPLRRFHSLPLNLNLTPAGRAPTLAEYAPACGGGGERS